MNIEPWMVLVLAAILYAALFYLRQPGRGGSLGDKIRWSDHMAWRDAVERKRRELDELLRAEPKR